MTTKYVYSPYRERHACPRTIKRTDEGDVLIEALQLSGSGVSYGKSMDTSEPYPTIEQLADDHYKNYKKGTLISSDIRKGVAWLASERSSDVLSVFAHKITKPGLHYVIEWKHTSTTSVEPYNEDFSPMYSTIEEAIKEVTQHMKRMVSASQSEDVHVEEDSKGYHYRLLLPGFRHDYSIISFNISEELYKKASSNRKSHYYATVPWIHFGKPND